ncbi:hypothetical protein BE61_48930 [Bradyrhizobium elkanii USDA 61]|nr:hypothetical protein BE61_48930 [Bradyrhizobium elkanii USDA 61]GEC58966.1 hypothetical protein BEL01nite_80090 [Bradyrhizobium elkanii]
MAPILLARNTPLIDSRRYSGTLLVETTDIFLPLWMPLYGNTTQGVVRKISYRTVKESVDSRATGPSAAPCSRVAASRGPGRRGLGLWGEGGGAGWIFHPKHAQISTALQQGFC